MDYLYTEHGYIRTGLTTPNDIVGYFNDEGYDLLDCGQGYYTEEAKIKVFIDGKSYEVTIKGEIDSAKQDRGDRLYWIESIESVTYEEIPTPEPKPRRNYFLNELVNVTEDQYNRVLQAINTICK